MYTDALPCQKQVFLKHLQIDMLTLQWSLSKCQRVAELLHELPHRARVPRIISFLVRFSWRDPVAEYRELILCS